jgi:acyl dehydratase
MSKYRYYEDFHEGQEIDLGARTVTEDEIIAFAREFDPQPFHVDREAAAASIYGGVIASGWHTCSMMMRMVVDGVMGSSSAMGSPGLEGVRWMQPVRAGDTLSVRYLTVKVKASTSRPDRGVVGRAGSRPTSAANRSARSTAWACSRAARLSGPP